MRWVKRDIWKVGITLTGLVLFLVLMAWVPLSAVAYEGTSGLVIPGSMQATPTVDVTATMTALNEEKLRQEIQQLKNQNNLNLLGWFQMNAAILLSTLVVVGGGLIGLFRWFGDRRDAQDKDLRSQAEERFKTAVTALGSENAGTQVGGAILLRSFLHEEDKTVYQRYYAQIFDLAVAYLRLPNTSQLSEAPTRPVPVTPLRQALISVLKEVFKPARDRLGQIETMDAVQSLDASNICLDQAYLVRSDLERIWMIDASLIEARLGRAKFHKADLRRAKLHKAILYRAILTEVNLYDADLYEADLRGATLNGANLECANLRGADLRGGIIYGEAISTANIEAALSLKDTDLRGVKGLTKEQKEACKAKGAIIDEETLADASQPTTSATESAPSTDAQNPSTPSPQANTTAASTDGNSSASSQPSAEP